MIIVIKNSLTLNLIDDHTNNSTMSRDPYNLVTKKQTVHMQELNQRTLFYMLFMRNETHKLHHITKTFVSRHTIDSQPRYGTC